MLQSPILRVHDHLKGDRDGNFGAFTIAGDLERGAREQGSGG